jgi:hypothetical protein
MLTIELRCKYLPDLDSRPPSKKELKQRTCEHQVKIVSSKKIQGGYSFNYKCPACGRAGRSEVAGLFL